MSEALLLGSMTATVTALGLYERWLHDRRLKRIPIRIHINGTRGKSSVTRLIAAGLRAGGVRTLAKTTGTAARLILPTGREIPLYRRGRPNILEQLRVVATASAQQVDALVLECMALQPQLQWLSERMLIRATHGVITNVRPDHLDVMGPTEENVAQALAGMVPFKGSLITAGLNYQAFYQRVCRDRDTEPLWVDATHVKKVNREVLERFSYLEYPDNVAVALAVCERVGVSREDALKGMWRASPDPGALKEFSLEFFGREITFLNGFAANDPISTETLWRDGLERHSSAKIKIALFNCRADRPDRSAQLGSAFGQWPRADFVVLTGSGTYLFAKSAVNAGIDPSTIVFAENHRAEEVFEVVAGLARGSAFVVGMANIGGVGMELVSYFANRARNDERQASRG